MLLKQRLHETPHTSRRAACALALMCALIPPASARQSSSGDPAPKQPTSSSSTATAATHKSTTHTATGKHSSRRKKSARTRGQQKIDAERAQEIQAALIREHYLTGQPSGSWNAASEEAMRRYQSDHGWQTKEVPDSRALISLGLGPSNTHLLNPESAMTTGPAEGHAAPSTSTSPGVDPGSTNKNATPPTDPRPTSTSSQDSQHPQ